MKLNPKTAQRQWARKFKKKDLKSDTIGQLFNPLTKSKWETVRNMFFTGKTATRLDPKTSS